MDEQDLEIQYSEDEHQVSGNLMLSRASQLDDILSEKLEQAFLKPTFQVDIHEIVKIATEYNPIDLASAAIRLPYSARYVLYDNLPNLDSKIQFIINTNKRTRSTVFRYLENKEIKEVVNNMPPDEAVNIFEDLPKRRVRAILDLLDVKKAARILDLFKHEPHTAGRIMTNEFFAFPMHTTLNEVIIAIREHPNIELSRRIFVLNDKGILIGYVLERNLIVNSPKLPLKKVMRPVIHKVSPNSSRDEVVDIVERYKIPALPVVDKSDFLVGVIAYEDVVEAMEDLADETIASIAGTVEDLSEHEPTIRRFLLRAPWLLVTLCAGLVTATNLSFFRDRLWFVFVPSFVPLIAGMSGNVGLQCSTTLVRSMSTGELSKGSRKEAILKELSIGLAAGIIFGIFCGTVVYFLNYFGIRDVAQNPIVEGTIVSCGVLGACLTATVLGSSLPFFFASIGVDPAIAAGPIVTAFNDVLSTLVYFFVAFAISYFLL